MKQLRNKPRPRRSVLGVLIVLAATIGSQACAEDSLQGEWVGIDMAGNTPSAVRVLVDGQRLSVRFGAPRRCSLAALFSAVDGNASAYEVSDSSGSRYCDALYPGRITLSQTAGGAEIQWSASSQATPLPIWRPTQAPVADHADPRLLRGHWNATLTSARGEPVPAQLMLAGVAPGDRGNSLRYGGSRACKLALAFEGDAAGEFEFSISPGETGGGYCDRLLDRRLHLQPRGDGVVMRIVPSVGECDAGCEFVRSGN